MSVTVGIDSSALEELERHIASYGDSADDAITKALHESGPDIYERINPLIHPSGRRFKGHGASATVSAWPQYVTDAHLAVTVKAKSKYRYLYFPDDGLNTDHHAGNQRFFERGAKAAAPRVIERCVAALTREWEA